MFFKRFARIIIFMSIFTLLIGSSVLADDGRINRAPYHFGGDTLFCNEEHGCTLLNMTGHDLANWPQSAIATALAAADQSQQRTPVAGKGQGTYGPMQLWAMPNKTENGNSTLCVVGFDEWGKQNDMCFQVTEDYHYEQAPLPVVPVTKAVVGEEVDHSCDNFSVGDDVMLIADNTVHGEVESVDYAHGTLVFDGLGAKCSEVEPEAK
ncbi:MAG: hypothetical protein H0X30_02890 [Anaerolineae bacterium]|nr:hypothetical protein [Anaerolineae bacterium]